MSSAIIGCVQVYVRARLAGSRAQGAASCFLVLRHRLHTCQCTVFADESKGGSVSKTMTKYVQQIPKESIVDITAKVAAAPSPIEQCTQKSVELQATDVHVVSRCALVVLSCC